MKLRFLATAMFLLLCFLAKAQNEITVSQFIKTPKDSLDRSQLLSSLNTFWSLTQEKNEQNNFVLPSQKLETYVLLDEFKDIEKSRKYKSDHFYKPYLNKVAELDKDKYLIQISNIGVVDSAPILMTVFNLIAHRQGNTFVFSSPLIKNTKNWKTKHIDNITVHYKDNISINKIKDFLTTQKQFDRMLKIDSGALEVYCCSNPTEVQSILGIQHKFNFNGRKDLSLSYQQKQTAIIVTSSFGEHFDSFDPHDLFHDRARKVAPRSTYNHYMVCGGGYIYGGSWGISWDKIKVMFKEKMLDNTKKDWLKLYLERYNFGESQEEHLLVTQFINALIIEKFQKEKGSDIIIKLINTGNFRRDKAKFFKNLDKLTGINGNNFNEKAEELFQNI